MIPCDGSHIYCTSVSGPVMGATFSFGPALALPSGSRNDDSDGKAHKRVVCSNNTLKS
jgi:hypothetical protein